MSRPNRKSEPLYPHQQWKADTDPLVQQLVNSNNRNLVGTDTMAWLFHIIGRLRNGLFSEEDKRHLINHFDNQAHGLLSDARSHFKQAIRTLLLLRYAPDAASETRHHWKEVLSNSRVQLSTLYLRNPSMKSFTDSMIRFSWRSARTDAANILSFGGYSDHRIHAKLLMGRTRWSAWDQRLPRKCPWNANTIAGFRTDSTPILVNSRQLPFEEPESYL